MRGYLAAAAGVTAAGLVLVPGAVSATSSAGLSTSVISAPADRTTYARPATADDRAANRIGRFPGLVVRDVVRASGQGPGTFGPATEPSIAVDPANPNRIAISAFYDFWFDSRHNDGRNAALFYSANGGRDWTENDTIPPGPGVGRHDFGPCDQTFDYGQRGRLYGVILVCTRTGTYLVTGSTDAPTRASAWRWCNSGPIGCPVNPDPRGFDDQPWLLVNRDPRVASQDNVYVGYDSFRSSSTGFFSNERVAVSYGANPVRFSVDNQAGTARPLFTNPALRLAKDPATGYMYAVYEQSVGLGGPSKMVTYKLNRSIDGGRTWSLNGNPDGITIDSVRSEQAPFYKFCTVNALLGGVDHAAVDPRTGDVYVVYGADTRGGHGNQILIRRVSGARSGRATVGRPSFVTTAHRAALPSVAVNSAGTVGVLYDTCEGVPANGYPKFAAHLARSSDHGRSFSDQLLLRFLSPAKDDGNSRQRVLGDYQQLKSVGRTFYGVFSGNRSAFGSNLSTTDPVFFRQG